MWPRRRVSEVASDSCFLATIFASTKTPLSDSQRGRSAPVAVTTRVYSPSYLSVYTLFEGETLHQFEEASFSLGPDVRDHWRPPPALRCCKDGRLRRPADVEQQLYQLHVFCAGRRHRTHVTHPHDGARDATLAVSALLSESSHHLPGLSNVAS